MNKTFLYLVLFISSGLSAQQNSIEKALALLQKDEQCKHAIISFYAIDAASGKTLVQINPEYGLAPASCQKIITSISAFELLGKNFHFNTKFAVDKNNFFIIGNGDPTLGSSRWNSTSASATLRKIESIFKKVNNSDALNNIIINDISFGYQPIPDGWVWQDIGNYYGAGAWSLNWKENTYTVTLRSPDIIHKPVEIISTDPPLYKQKITSFIHAASANSGDHAWLYAAPFVDRIFATGTIPVSEKNFVIKGAMPYPSKDFAEEVSKKLKIDSFKLLSEVMQQKITEVENPELIDSILSPSLDSINFWFLKSSVNLFGEAFLKAIGSQRGDPTATSGIEEMRLFWKNKIDISALNILDGSGLSPANRITTKLLVQFLQYAAKKNWYPSFYNALPVINGIKMKDGYIGGVRSYAGLIRQQNGKEVIFAFIVNNFNGSPSTVREKMWRILDLLK